MPKTNSPSFTQKIKNTGTTFLTADSTNYKVIATAGENDSRVVRITISSNDIANKAFFAIRKNTVEYPIAWTNIPLNSGTDGVADCVEALISTTFYHRQIDNNANPFFELEGGVELVMKLLTAPTATKAVNVLVTQEDY